MPFADPPPAVSTGILPPKNNLLSAKSDRSWFDSDAFNPKFSPCMTQLGRWRG